MKYGIPTSQGAGIFVFYGQGGPALPYGLLHVKRQPGGREAEKVEGETEWQSV
jgi:hypothetical protein